MMQLSMVCWILILINAVYLIIGGVECLIARRYMFMLERIVIYPRIGKMLLYIYYSIGIAIIIIDLYMAVKLLSPLLSIMTAISMGFLFLIGYYPLDILEKAESKIKIGIHITEIASPLVALLRDETIPRRCLRVVKRTLFFDIGWVDRKCLNEYVNSIVSRYRIVDICVEKSRNIKQYEKCLRNVEKYGVEPDCAEYVLDEKKYRLCIELSRHIK